MPTPLRMGIAVLLLSLVAFPEEAGARNPIRADFFARYPGAAGTQLDGLPSDSKHCGVCHFKDEDRPRNLTWYSLASGKPAVVHVDVDPVSHIWAPGLDVFKAMHLEPVEPPEPTG